MTGLQNFILVVNILLEEGVAGLLLFLFRIYSNKVTK